ncbi:TnsD family Tn7-like transposition protein [Clostridium magnum]|uniref:Uncharacterized protein n=1 Tax=Clostridium magnum DSM 2767 TaxID=1121326 RepID=A0A161Y520_9CLOT|nr:TnsD family Tn7-like transposition protein [Clostridium magnum]KZL93249.1 hypothetical protein CLMAG_02720 [Clostridium magnum DSM 2767]SHI19242.1 TniQ protein [Clostridium magnum DSM 2767]
MINDLFRLYDDELLYSAIGRYHIVSGSLNYKKTLQELFETDSVVASLEFTGYLDNLSNMLPNELNIDSNYLIYNHTILPIYLPFLPESRKYIILQKIKSCCAKDLKTQTGFIAGSIMRNNGIMYCPLCAKFEVQKFGEAYVHRLHQVEGILTCPTHKCFLNTYKIHQNKVSRLQFITFHTDILEFDRCNFIDNSLSILTEISNGMSYLLKNELDNFDQNKIHHLYIQLLRNKGLVTNSQRIEQRKLYEKFISYYGIDILKLLKCLPDSGNEYNWLKVITRKPKRVVNPLRQVLFMIFLVQSVEEFFKIPNNFNISRKKFPCLNPVCDKYKKYVINRYNIKKDCKTNDEIGTFYCKCGFVYSRNMNRNNFSIGRVVCYGELWEKNLRDLILKGGYSIRNIALLMKCDSKTIVKYAEKMGLKHLLPTKQKVNKTMNIIKTNVNPEQYKQDMINIIQKFPQYNRTQVRGLVKKQYMWLYRHDKKWLDENLNTKKLCDKSEKNVLRVDWNNRDEKLLDMLQSEYKILIQLSKRPRITKSLIGRRINYLSLLEKHLDKLPKTKRYLNKILESVEEFQRYRIIEVLNGITPDKEEIVIWKVLRKAGLRGSFKDKVKKIIENKA